MLADNPRAGGLFTRIPNFEVNIIVSSHKISEEIVPAKKFIRQLRDGVPIKSGRADEKRLVA